MSHKDYGFFRVAAAVPRVKVADVKYNTEATIRMALEADSAGVSLIVFPELGIPGYTCADLFGQDLLISSCEKAVGQICTATRGRKITVIAGVPVPYRGRLYNCAAVIRNGNIKGFVPKTWVPDYNEFYESRWFASGQDFLSRDSISSSPLRDDGKCAFREGFGGVLTYCRQKVNISPNMLFRVGKATVAIEICEDLWTPVPPSSWHALAGADVIVNLSASDELLMKHRYRKELTANQSARTISGYIYASCGFGESTQDLVFAGSSLIYENGTLMAENQRFGIGDSVIMADIDIEKLQNLRRKESTFDAVTPDGRRAVSFRHGYSMVEVGEAPDTDFEEKLLRKVEPHPFVPEGSPEEIDARAREITSIQVLGLATRLEHIGCRTAVLGISGGLDSTLALLVTVLAFDKLGWDRKRIIGITMPGLGTTSRTRSNATDLMEALGITSREIPIGDSVALHFKDIGQDPDVHDVTYENSQARERTQILMDISNKEDGIVVGTGDLSELALGWCTYNGDHMSMYGVNAGIPKTLVRYLVKWAAENHFDAAESGARTVREIIFDIVDTPISPELTPADAKGAIAQKTEDLVGPYELHDFFLYNFFRFGYSPSKVLFLARKAFLGNGYDEETILKWLRKFYWRFLSQQFKRSCLPDGPKVGTVTLSPRGDWRMPSDSRPDLFTGDLD